MKLIRYTHPLFRQTTAATPVARNPWALFDSDVDRLFAPLFGAGAFHAPVQFDADENNYFVRVALPGVKRDAITLEWVDESIELTVKGKSENKDEPAPEYRRALQVPTDVEVEQIKASLEDGVLTLTLPKSAAAKPRRIELN